MGEGRGGGERVAIERELLSWKAEAILIWKSEKSTIFLWILLPSGAATVQNESYDSSPVYLV